MTNVFHRNPQNEPPVAVGGSGMYLTDAKGKEYIDASGGAAVSCLGHGDPDVIKAIQVQADKLAFAHTGFLSSEPAEQLADLLVEKAPAEFGKVFYVSGGSEAVESALKLANHSAAILLPANKVFMAIRWGCWRQVAINGGVNSLNPC